MEKYNYLESITEDVKEYIKENFESLEDVDQDRLYDDLFIEDSITGNASGSYTFNAYEAEENIAHNHDLLKEAQEMFGFLPTEYISHGAEWADVTIRCYLLGQAIEKAINELEEEAF